MTAFGLMQSSERVLSEQNITNNLLPRREALITSSRPQCVMIEGRLKGLWSAQNLKRDRLLMQNLGISEFLLERYSFAAKLLGGEGWNYIFAPDKTLL